MQYLTSLSEEQLVKNTMTGFLITLLRGNPEGLTLEDLLNQVTKVYPYLRKPSGQLYSSDDQSNPLRSLKGALSANGLFE